MTKTRIKTTTKINIQKIATVHSLSLQFDREFLLDHIELLQYSQKESIPKRIEKSEKKDRKEQEKG